jgi:hypothetical protein
MKGYITTIENDTVKNKDFRRVSILGRMLPRDADTQKTS